MIESDSSTVHEWRKAYGKPQSNTECHPVPISGNGRDSEGTWSCTRSSCVHIQQFEAVANIVKWNSHNDSCTANMSRRS